MRVTAQQYVNAAFPEGVGHRFGVTELIDIGTVGIDFTQTIREVVMARDEWTLDSREDGFDPRKLIGRDMPSMCVIRRFIGGCRGIETDEIDTADTVHERGGFTSIFGTEPSIRRCRVRIVSGNRYIVVSRDRHNGGSKRIQQLPRVLKFGYSPILREITGDENASDAPMIDINDSVTETLFSSMIYFPRSLI